MKTIRGLAILMAAIAAASVAIRFGLGAAAGAALPPASGFVLVAHGGAGDYSKMSSEQIEMRRAAMAKAVQAGYAILAKKGGSLDAVEATIRVMEDSGLFDAGRGSYHTREGVPEMDAAIMDGRTLNAWSAASLKHIATPIHPSRLLLETTPHVMLVPGTGVGEYFMRDIVAAAICERVRYVHVTLEQAANDVVMKELVEQHGDGGVIALDPKGNVSAPFNTEGMMTATVRADAKITLQGWSKNAKPVVVSAK